jgi:hypothetical protein
MHSSRGLPFTSSAGHPLTIGPTRGHLDTLSSKRRPGRHQAPSSVLSSWAARVPGPRGHGHRRMGFRREAKGHSSHPGESLATLARTRSSRRSRQPGAFNEGRKAQAITVGERCTTSFPGAVARRSGTAGPLSAVRRRRACTRTSKLVVCDRQVLCLADHAGKVAAVVVPAARHALFLPQPLILVARDARPGQPRTTRVMLHQRRCP